MIEKISPYDGKKIHTMIEWATAFVFNIEQARHYHQGMHFYLYLGHCSFKYFYTFCTMYNAFPLQI